MVQKKATEVRRDEIITATLAIIEQKGLEHVSIANIAAAIHLVPSAIYRHYSGKEEIIDSLIDFVDKALQDNVRYVLATETDAVARLHLLLQRHVELVREQQAIPRILFSLVSSEKEKNQKQKMYAVIARYLDQVRRIIEQGSANREIGSVDATTASILFLGMIQPLAILSRLDDNTLDQYPEKVWDMYLHGICHSEYK